MQFLLQLLSSAAEAGQAAALLGMEARGTLTLGTELKPPPKKTQNQPNNKTPNLNN